MPKLTYKKKDYYFYKWWSEIYKEQMDLYEKFSKSQLTARTTDRDFQEWNILHAYYFGLCDGRNGYVKDQNNSIKI